LRKKIITVIGARPQFIKAAAISRMIGNSYADKMEEIIIHTGQHYDANMSDVFFKELQIPEPSYNLNVGSNSHALQTAEMMMKLEPILLNEKPDAVLVYGDTNSTLAAAMVSSKLNIPIIHVEAGLRSFQKSMPEEINRIITDHCSSLLFCPTETAVQNLKAEGFSTEASNNQKANADNPSCIKSGDVMYDNVRYYGNIAEENLMLMNELQIESQKFILLTIHRPINTDHPKRLESILAACLSILKQNDIKIILPIHPRTSQKINESINPEIPQAIENAVNFIITDPKSYLEMLLLEKHARLIITDSGGVQKEAYFFNKNVLILRHETEWNELIQNQCAVLVDADEDKIVSAASRFMRNTKNEFPALFGNGNAAEIICNTIIEKL
jgi:UDP-GlcNAc3NAcA epimerase